MSKSGLIGRFGDKEAMQRAVLAAAIERFTDAVWRPAERAEPGLARGSRRSSTPGSRTCATASSPAAAS